jgi:hypothetical protein
MVKASRARKRRIAKFSVRSAPESIEMTQPPPLHLLLSKADCCHFARPHHTACKKPKNIRRPASRDATVESD